MAENITPNPQASQTWCCAFDNKFAQKQNPTERMESCKKTCSCDTTRGFCAKERGRPSKIGMGMSCKICAFFG
jgi:hypothetical protein